MLERPSGGQVVPWWCVKCKVMCFLTCRLTTLEQPGGAWCKETLVVYEV